METESALDVDREEFFRRLQELHKVKALKTLLLTRERYDSLIKQVKLAKEKVTGKSTADYRRVKRFNIVETANGERLFTGSMYPASKRKQEFITIEESFDIIRQCHLRLNHGGRNRMMINLKTKYNNITTESVKLYLSMCSVCKTKKPSSWPRNRTANKTVKDWSLSSDNEDLELPSNDDHFDDPLTTSEINASVEKNEKIYKELFSRGQMDVLDIIKDTDEEFKLLLIYRDMVTKFIQLRPLKSTKINEISEVVLDIFLVFGAPNVLQSKNGSDMIKPICRRISSRFPDIKVIPVEIDSKYDNFHWKSNEDILKLLNEWITKLQCANWPDALKFIQNELNNTFDGDIKKTPYEAAMGKAPNRGLASILPKQEYEYILTEEDLKSSLDPKSPKLSLTKIATTEMLVKEVKIEPCPEGGSEVFDDDL